VHIRSLAPSSMAACRYRSRSLCDGAWMSVCNRVKSRSNVLGMRADDFASTIGYEKYEMAGTVVWCREPLVPDLDVWQKRHQRTPDNPFLNLSRCLARSPLVRRDVSGKEVLQPRD